MIYLFPFILKKVIDFQKSNFPYFSLCCFLLTDRNCKWSGWTQWTVCQTENCSGGQKYSTRRRTPNNPTREGNGKHCFGKDGKHYRNNDEEIELRSCGACRGMYYHLILH